VGYKSSGFGLVKVLNETVVGFRVSMGYGRNNNNNDDNNDNNNVTDSV